MDWEDWPVILGYGTANGVGPEKHDEPEPRLAGLRSVSPAAMRALSKTPGPKAPRRHPIGFHRPRKP